MCASMCHVRLTLSLCGTPALLCPNFISIAEWDKWDERKAFSKRALIRALNQLGYYASSKEEVDELFDEMDTHQSGHVDFDDWTRATNGLLQGPSSQAKPTTRRKAGRAGGGRSGRSSSFVDVSAGDDAPSSVPEVVPFSSFASRRQAAAHVCTDGNADPHCGAESAAAESVVAESVVAAGSLGGSSRPPRAQSAPGTRGVPRGGDDAKSSRGGGRSGGGGGSGGSANDASSSGTGGGGRRVEHYEGSKGQERLVRVEYRSAGDDEDEEEEGEEEGEEEEDEEGGEEEFECVLCGQQVEREQMLQQENSRLLRELEALRQRKEADEKALADALLAAEERIRIGEEEQKRLMEDMGLAQLAVINLESALGGVINQHSMGLCRGCGWFGALGTPCGCGTGRRISALRGARAEAQAQATAAIVSEAARRVSTPRAAVPFAGGIGLSLPVAPYASLSYSDRAAMGALETPAESAAAGFHPLLPHAYSAALARLLSNPQTHTLVPPAMLHTPPPPPPPPPPAAASSSRRPQSPPPRAFAHSYGEYSDVLARVLGR